MQLRHLCLVTLIVLVGCSRRAPSDGLVGSWTLDRGATRYGGGAPVRVEEKFSCITAGQGVKCTINGKREDGTVVEGSFSANYDGRHYAVAGVPGVDTVRLQRVNPAVVDATFLFRDKLVFGYRAFAGTDGRSLIVVAVDPSARQVLNSVVVYRAQ